ncbi:MAG: 3-dehydroquinate synthase [Mariprofundales bacterium]|nr:3-dehydroquinate synthase [Mariprofundales bacterium]
MIGFQCYRVDLGDRSYDIRICPGSLDGLGAAIALLLPSAKRCLVVSNAVVAPLYMARVRASLEAAGWQVIALILADGEQSKTLANWSRILDCLMAHKLSRNEPVVALGGGVIGDMAGFAAASYRRGLPLVQVPTTLLSQVDSSVGGKTAVNHPDGKNMIGAFYQPRLVWIDSEVLATLAPRQLRAGLAEVIKYGLIRDGAFFSRLQELMPGLLTLDSAAIAEVIHSSCRHKAEVVMRDECESGERALLNFGHTFGHAIESLAGYGTFLHGEAVAIGMRMATRLSHQMGLIDASYEQRVLEALTVAELPSAVPKFAPEAWLDAMGNDKKNLGSGLRLVLLRAIGDARIVDSVGADAITRLVASYDDPR